MTDDEEAELRLLSLSNHKRKFAIQVGLNPGGEHGTDADQLALERGIDEEWFTLVDISTVTAAGRPVPMRVFRLTEKGLVRLADLARMKGVS